MYTSEEYINRENRYKIEQLENKIKGLEEKIDYNSKKFEEYQSDNLRTFYYIAIPLGVLIGSFSDELLRKYGIPPSVSSYVFWLYLLYIFTKGAIFVYRDAHKKKKNICKKN